MKRIIAAIIVIGLALALPASAEDDIYRLIERGRLQEARDALSNVSTAALRNGNNLFFQALLESDGKRAAELMEIALNSSVSTEYREDIYLRLAEYYYLTGANHKLQRLIVDYRTTWEDGRYRDRMLRYSIAVDERAGASESALHQVDRYLLDYTSGETEQWGEIDKARILKSGRKDIGSARIAKQLSRRKSGPGVPQALYLLTLEGIRSDRPDDAVFYYNLLREAYPVAIGLDALIDRMDDVSGGSESRDIEANEITGTFYSIQVGVFSQKGNAEKMADRFRGYGHKVEIRSKTVSDVRYHVVYVGHFNAYHEAAAEKAKFEQQHNEVFQVVAR